MRLVKSVVVLGSTGSIGRQALEVLSALRDRLAIEALACGRNWRLLAEQALTHRPKRVAVADPGGMGELATALAGTGVDVFGGEEGVLEIARTPADITLAAIAGSAGVSPTLAAAASARVLALANKESLVEAGGLLLERVRQAKATLLPVDSEHSAVFQGLQAGRREEVRRIILTASGGPFYGLTREELKRVTPREALAHPTWHMGEKITVDSATLVNKAFEVVEAHWLFGLEEEAIEVLIHPESVVHGLVEFRDGSVLAQMGTPDMRLPIQYALTWPERADAGWKPLSLAAVGALHFAEPDLERFPGLGLGWELIRRGGTVGAVAVKANEVAREAFLRGQLSFPSIYEVIRRVLDEHEEKPVTGLEDVTRAEAWAEKQAGKVVEQVA
jgi:1-deoxy-D-xylulose-5-phosphate reductoisomerase